VQFQHAVDANRNIEGASFSDQANPCS
jgi:hypothetical protein